MGRGEFFRGGGKVGKVGIKVAKKELERRGTSGGDVTAGCRRKKLWMGVNGNIGLTGRFEEWNIIKWGCMKWD